MQPTPAEQPAVANPFDGLYGFVRAHLMIVNNVILASITLVSVLDFLAPSVSILPRVVYFCTAVLVALMLIGAFAPAFIAKLLHVIGMTGARTDLIPVWKRPLWQVVLGILLGVTVVGFASIAKAGDGGLLASKFPEIRRLQTALLSIQADTTEIKYGVASANAKLDTLVADSKDPQKDVVARGYPYTTLGLTRAVEQSDKLAVSLFVKAGFQNTDVSVMAKLINGKQKWNPEIGALLTPNMFEIPVACTWPIGNPEEPVVERILLYKRLCGVKKNDVENVQRQYSYYVDSKEEWAVTRVAKGKLVVETLQRAN